MSDDIDVWKSAFQKIVEEQFSPLWEKIGPHAMIGGAVRTFWNEETGKIDMEAIDPADMYSGTGLGTPEQADAYVTALVGSLNPFMPFILDAALEDKREDG